MGNGSSFQCLSFNLKISLPFSINAHWEQFPGCLNHSPGVSNLLGKRYIWHLPPCWTHCSMPYSFSWALPSPCPYTTVDECQLEQNPLHWRKHQVNMSIWVGEREVGRKKGGMAHTCWAHGVGQTPSSFWALSYILRLTPSQKASCTNESVKALKIEMAPKTGELRCFTPKSLHYIWNGLTSKPRTLETFSIAFSLDH